MPYVDNSLYININIFIYYEIDCNVWWWLAWLSIECNGYKRTIMYLHVVPDFASFVMLLTGFWMVMMWKGNNYVMLNKMICSVRESCSYCHWHWKGIMVMVIYIRAKEKKNNTNNLVTNFYGSQNIHCQLW